ncbi:zinc finger protein 239-like [Ornithodoros turicata]|uniref:zinc finger protein 239-like n=1 Tax=Ornithodoros turicata TaxID=34597 RepID=UPI00313A42EF
MAEREQEKAPVPSILRTSPEALVIKCSSGCTFSNARFEVSRATVEARLNNTAVVTMEDPPTERPPEKSKSCGLACTSKARLQHHMFAHCHSESEKCPATLPPNIQVEEEGFGCDVCHSAFSQSVSHANHVSKRTDEKTYMCDLCPAEFIQGTHLQRHKMMHTGENPWKCDLYPAEFNWNAHLRLHKRTHKEEKPFKCDVCLAKFSRTVTCSAIRGHTPSSHLQRHKKTQTGEKPYKCNVCPAKFSRSGHLRDHKRTHMGEQP